jgi:hypothetical protein
MVQRLNGTMMREKYGDVWVFPFLLDLSLDELVVGI